jgi:hypothetical protein
LFHPLSESKSNSLVGRGLFQLCYGSHLIDNIHEATRTPFACAIGEVRSGDSFDGVIDCPKSNVYGHAVPICPKYSLTVF